MLGAQATPRSRLQSPAAKRSRRRHSTRASASSAASRSSERPGSSCLIRARPGSIRSTAASTSRAPLGSTHIAGSTGSTSEACVQKLYGLPEIALIDMGDFVGGMLKYIRTHPVPQVTIAGGVAKMSKLAQGMLDLHSKRGTVDLRGARRCRASGRRLERSRQPDSCRKHRRRGVCAGRRARHRARRSGARWLPAPPPRAWSKVRASRSRS